MYNLLEELKYTMEMLDDEGNDRSAQAVSQAIIHIENLTYEADLYKRAYNEGRC